MLKNCQTCMKMLSQTFYTKLLAVEIKIKINRKKPQLQYLQKPDVVFLKLVL